MKPIPTIARLHPYMSNAAQALAETCWPTRCAVCDMPGSVLCDTCRINLSYLDWWQACPHCGAPFGRMQCTECNDIALNSAARKTLPYDSCASAVIYDHNAARIVQTWKDKGERRLAAVMASLIKPLVPAIWLLENPVVIAIPATLAAYRRRGFDHGADLAYEVAAPLNLKAIPMLTRPSACDQRALTRGERLRNMEGKFSILPGIRIPSSVFIIDDVCTTGATLFAASDALRAAGVRTIRCLTFARVW